MSNISRHVRCGCFREDRRCPYYCSTRRFLIAFMLVVGNFTRASLGLGFALSREKTTKQVDSRGGLSFGRNTVY